MRNITLILTILALLFFSCDDNGFGITDKSSREEDNIFLETLSQEIHELVGEFDCVDASEWKFTAIGAKACGGPAGYIAYSIKIDTVVFLEKVNLYTKQQEIYNKKWGIISDCTVPQPPEEIVCVDGQPEFVYE